ncbi:MAG: hypothetical protein H6969_06380 [Gammaproteobacteria bacterium]|nr:hypothetical protein [Gammaproteobacteria bacterium]
MYFDQGLERPPRLREISANATGKPSNRWYGRGFTNSCHLLPRSCEEGHIRLNDGQIQSFNAGLLTRLKFPIAACLPDS